MTALLQEAAKHLGGCHVSALLTENGFVHITGLPTFDPIEDAERIVQANQCELGCWNCDNDKTIVITMEGEVWLCDGHAKKDLLRIACPRDRSVFIKCLNNESFYSFHLLKRVKDPHSDCNGIYPATPRPR